LKRSLIALVVLVVVSLVPIVAGCGGLAVTTTASQPETATTQAQINTSESVIAPTSESNSISLNWEDNSGYTCSVELTVWDAIPADNGGAVTHPGGTSSSNVDPTIEAGIDYDPATDLVIPVGVTVRNTTPDFDLSDLSLGVDCHGMEVRDPNYTLSSAFLLDFMWFFSSGADTEQMVVEMDSINTFRYLDAFNNQHSGHAQLAGQAQWSTLAPGKVGRVLGFAILHDYYTPARSGFGQVGSDLGPEALTLSGQRVADEFH
jgi:hypothetical protein